ncbi:glycosyltransferase [Flavobacterium sp. TMP13]|uniref:glycosyltransferase n=1 Tax=Flavobacterium sp. TMP13 TaxID=3425950 RepID=UPI003D77793A
MKVIHYIASIDKSAGGTTEYMRLLSNELKEKISFSIATGRSKDPIKIDGVSIKFFNTSIFRWFSLGKEFKIYLKNENPDIVHINGIWSPQNWGFQKAAQQLGIKVIISPHGMLEPWILANNSLKKKLALFLYQEKAIKRAIYLHATAPMEAKTIRDLGFKNSVSTIPNGINCNDVKLIKGDYGNQKIVFLSRIHRKKGIEILLDAWRNCDTKNWKLEIAGNGDEEYVATLKLRCAELKNVQFVGVKYGEDKWNFLRSADVMILPTHSENFGIVVAESLAVGVPVVTTKGTPWQDLEKHQCGWWIELSVLNLEKAIAEVINTSVEELKNMGMKGRKLVEEKYEIKVVSNKIIDLYQTILTEN